MQSDSERVVPHASAQSAMTPFPHTGIVPLVYADRRSPQLSCSQHQQVAYNKAIAGEGSAVPQPGPRSRLPHQLLTAGKAEDIVLSVASPWRSEQQAACCNTTPSQAARGLVISAWQRRQDVR